MTLAQAREPLRFYQRALAAEIVELLIRDRVELSDEAREQLGALENE